MKQHWLVTLTSLTGLTNSDMSLISWHQASQPELVGVGHCFAWQGYLSLLAIDNCL